MSKCEQRPLFVLGVPRSGTTLMRELITRHSLVAMPKDEFQLLPYFLSKYPSKHELSVKDKKDILHVLKKSPFYFHLESEKSIDGLELPCQDIENTLMTVLSYFCPGHSGEVAHWIGEKTPNNLLRITEVANRFPKSKFVHVLRDPRDVVLSMNKAWGKSLSRAVLSWEKSIAKAIAFERECPDRIIHIKYEDLIQNTEAEMRRICSFLSIGFDKNMCLLESSREQMGDAAGLAEIKQDNSAKYLKAMTVSDIAKIDGYLGKYLDRFEYSRTYSDERICTNGLALKLLTVFDFICSFRWHIKNKGFYRGISYRLKQAFLG